MSACNTIPVLYDARALDTNKFNYEDEVLIFSTFEELKNALQQKPKNDVTLIAKDFTYLSFTQRMMKYANKRLSKIPQRVEDE